MLHRHPPVLVVRGSGLPAFSPLNPGDESGGRELEESEAEQGLHLCPNPLNRVSVEPETVSH